MSGGRSNQVWKVGAGDSALVCKLFRPAAQTPLFANDPSAEALALTALRNTGMAPRLIAESETPIGHSLIYSYAPGAAWRSEVGPVAALLRRLHGIAPPEGLPAAMTGSERLIRKGREILASVGPDGAALAALEPDPPEVDAGVLSFLHGDVVPGNLLESPGGLTLIDWQCPARGDACDDLALFLSPAMQHAYGNPPLTTDDELAFLEAYGDAAVADRYRLLARAYHWRMAAYCLWKVKTGDRSYALGAELETARLITAGHSNSIG